MSKRKRQKVAMGKSLLTWGSDNRNAAPFWSWDKPGTKGPQGLEPTRQWHCQDRQGS